MSAGTPARCPDTATIACCGTPDEPARRECRAPCRCRFAESPRCRYSGDQSPAACDKGCFGAAGYLQRRQGRLHMAAHGVFREIQAAPDHLVGQPLTEQIEYLVLP